MEPRPTYHDFAHTLLPSEAHHDPESLWEALSGDAPADWLADQWSMAGGCLRGEAPQLAGSHTLDEGRWEVLLVEPPPPQAPTEAWWIAVVRRPEDARDVGCFVLERTEEGKGQIVEWRPGPTASPGERIAPHIEVFLSALEADLLDRPIPAFSGEHTPTTPSNRHLAIPQPLERSPLRSNKALMLLAAFTLALGAAVVVFGLML